MTAVVKCSSPSQTLYRRQIDYLFIPEASRPVQLVKVPPNRTYIHYSQIAASVLHLAAFHQSHRPVTKFTVAAIVMSRYSSRSSSSSPASRLSQLASHISSPRMGSVFAADVVPQAPEDPLFGLMAAYKADTFDKKVDLGIGAYRDDNAKPWVLPVVKKVSHREIGASTTETDTQFPGR